MSDKEKMIKHSRPLEGTNKTIIHYDTLQNYIIPEKVEEIKDAKYLGEFTLKTVDGGWANKPVQLYFQENPPENAESNYFALHFNGQGEVLISDGKSAVENVFYSGVLNEKTNEVLYSAYRHDYQKHGDLIADGGRDYFRGSLHSYVQFYIDQGEFLPLLIMKGD